MKQDASGLEGIAGGGGVESGSGGAEGESEGLFMFAGKCREVAEDECEEEEEKEGREWGGRRGGHG